MVKSGSESQERKRKNIMFMGPCFLKCAQLLEFVKDYMQNSVVVTDIVSIIKHNTAAL